MSTIPYFLKVFVFHGIYNKFLDIMNFKSSLKHIPLIKRIYPSITIMVLKFFNKKKIIYKFKKILFELNINEPMDRSILLFNYYENEQINFLKDFLKKQQFNYFIDVGANSGFYTLILSNNFKKINFLGFEPVKNTFLKLKKNIFLNKYPKNIKIYNFGLSDKNSTLKMKALKKNNYIQLGGFGVANKNEDLLNFHSENAKFKIGDEQLKIKNKKICIKIDVEGHESFVLDGLKKLIKQNEVLLQIEIFDKFYSLIKKKLNLFGFKEINKIHSDGKTDYYFKKKFN